LKTSRAALASVYLQQNDTAKAEETLRQASADLSDSPQGVRLLADYYFATGKQDKAVAELASQAQKYPKNIALQTTYVQALMETGQQNKAESLIKQLVKDHPKDGQVAVLNGIMLLKDDKTSDAVETFQTALKDSPDDYLAHYWLARAYVSRGDGER